MTLKINYLDTQKGLSKNTALFLGNDTKISEIKGIFDDKINQKILNYLKKSKNNKNNKIDSINIDFDQKIILIILSGKNNSQASEELGAKFYEYVKKNDIQNITIVGSNYSSTKNKILLSQFIHGAELKSYEFNLYKTKKTKKEIILNILKRKNLINPKIKYKLDAILNGVNFTKDLVSEPGNVLHPDEYAKRLIKLKKIGLKVTVYDKKKLKKLGCNALLGVGQGSIRGSYLVTIEWKGNRSKSKPLAFVGKK